MIILLFHSIATTAPSVPSEKTDASNEMPTAEQTEFKAYLDKHGVEEAMSVAVNRLMKMKERPPDPVATIGRILCSIDATATKPEDTEAQAALRTKVGTVLAPLKGTTETEKSTHKHALPEALQKFVTLAEEPAIIEVAKPLQALEAAVARAPDSGEAVVALEAEQLLHQLWRLCKGALHARTEWRCASRARMPGPAIGRRARAAARRSR